VRRVGHLFEQVASFQALRAAFERARQGKAGTPSVERFARRLEPELFGLEAELLAGTWRPGPTVTFEVWDPKRRTITVAPFRDRVVHHALIGALGPVLERGMDPDSYGCRVGKGTDGALARAVALARRHPWALRADVASFFASVPHEPLLDQLARLVKDRRLLDVLERVVRVGGDPATGRGLPIGHLTSQWLANLYLTPLDRRLRALPDVRGYVRYMDDLVVFGATAAALRGVRDALAAFLADPLGLALNERVTRVHRTRDGFPFLGFTVRPGGLRLRGSTWRRLRRGVAARERLFRRGALDEGALAASVQSTLAHVGRADSRGLRRAWLAREPPIVW
jgi:RNA-directed DNA polymerase